MRCSQAQLSGSAEPPKLPIVRLVETALPAERLAASVRALATSVADPGARAQLHALAGILDNFGAPAPPPAERAAAASAIARAMADEDEAGAIAAARRLAAMDRAGLRHVDWSAASGG